MLRNFVRDALHAWTISEHAFRPGVDSVRGALKTLRESGGLRDMMFAGASFMGGYVNAGDPGEVARAIRRALRARGYDAAAADRYLATVLDTPARLWEKYRSLGDALENANREATFEATLRATGSTTEAAYQAKDLMDYSMRGNWTLFRLLGDVLPFFNARLQGLYKLGRAGGVESAPDPRPRGVDRALLARAPRVEPRPGGLRGARGVGPGRELALLAPGRAGRDPAPAAAQAVRDRAPLRHRARARGPQPPRARRHEDLLRAPPLGYPRHARLRPGAPRP